MGGNCVALCIRTQHIFTLKNVFIHLEAGNINYICEGKPNRNIF